MINYISNNKSSSKYVDIINEFRNTIDFINNNDILVEKLFQLLKKYFSFDAIGIFFNSPDKFETNMLHLFTMNNSVDFSYIENIFFKEISKYKHVIKQTIRAYYQSSKPEIINSEAFSHELILPFNFNNNFIGSICIFSREDMLKTDLDTFNLIINELLSIFKLKYIFTEQVFKSSVDSLTGLYNRNQFNIELEHEFNRANRYNSPFTITMIDIDYFKKINDTLGHQFGDYILIEISKLIQDTLRKTDIVYRYGGEEIVIIMPETSASNALLPIEKLRQIIEQHDFNNHNVTISAGISEYKKEYTSPEELLKQADSMLYKAKKNGRNNVCS